MVGLLVMIVLVEGLKKKSVNLELPRLICMGEAIGLVDGKLNALVPCAIDDVEGVGALGPVNPVKSSHCVNVPKRELLGVRDTSVGTPFTDCAQTGLTIIPAIRHPATMLHVFMTMHSVKEQPWINDASITNDRLSGQAYFCRF